MSATAVSKHTEMAEALVREAHANNGLAPVDLERFWADQEVALADPFGRDIPQVAVGALVGGDCIFDELGIPEDFYRYYHDVDWRHRMFRRYNDKAEAIIGRRPLPDEAPDPNLKWPAFKGLADVFEAKNVWHNESFWLMQSADDEDELAALLDRVERRLETLRDFMLPPEWDGEKARLLEAGATPPRYRGQRGPITFATSVFGVENLIFLIHDNPELAARFRDLILRSIIAIAEVLDAEAGDTPETAPRGWGWCDDNCCLLTPEMYEFFGYPILKGVFDRFSPGPEDRRFQHSDSAMGHLLPVLGKLDLTGTNFGPTVMVDEIRAHLPRAVIGGELAPFTYSRNEEVGIVEEFLRDVELIGDSRGLLFTTAGSINNGTRLTGARLIMAAVQRYGRYDR